MKRKDYWSASWQPVGKDLEKYKSECHHGTAYTKMMADYSDIHSEVRYYVPLEQSYEVWSLGSGRTILIRNENLHVTGYAEFTNNSNYEQDQVNLQYSQYITRTVFRGNRVRQMIHANLDRLDEGEKVDNKDVTKSVPRVWPACQWIPGAVKKKHFWGDITVMDNPVGVIDGKLNCEGNYNENSCGALTAVLSLPREKRKRWLFL